MFGSVKSWTSLLSLSTNFIGSSTGWIHFFASQRSDFFEKHHSHPQHRVGNGPQWTSPLDGFEAEHGWFWTFTTFQMDNKPPGTSVGRFRAQDSTQKVRFLSKSAGRIHPLPQSHPFNFATRHRNFPGEKLAIPTRSVALGKNYEIDHRMHFEFKNLEIVSCAREKNLSHRTMFLWQSPGSAFRAF